MAFYASKAMRTALAAAVALALSSCGKGGDAAQGGQPAGREAPAPVVGVVTVHPQTVALTVELPGRLESLRTADVRAQVGGIIQKRLFQEGSYVRAGQPLYQIDSSTYEAGLESARAQLATAQATLAKADADLARYKPLVSADAISKQEYDAAVTAKRSAEASVKAAQAAIKSMRHQSEPFAHYRADFGLYRSVQSFRRYAVECGRYNCFSHHPPNQSDVCERYPVCIRSDETALTDSRRQAAGGGWCDCGRHQI